MRQPDSEKCGNASHLPYGKSKTPGPRIDAAEFTQQVDARSEWSKHVCHRSVELEVFQHDEELLLFVAEVVLHQSGHTIEVPVKFVGCRSAIDSNAEPLQEMSDHRVIPLERAQHWREVRVGGLDGRKQGAIFTLMVPVQGGTEPMAVQQ